MSEENVAILGGHSVDDEEMKFGYSVTGTIDTAKVITNAGSNTRRCFAFNQTDWNGYN